MNRDDRFLKREYIKNLYAIMFSVLGGTINALIDSAFVSQRLGNTGLAALNLSMPVYLILCTIGALIAGGASIMSAQAIGKERMKDASRHYGSALFLLLVSGVAITVVGMALSGGIASLLAQGAGLKSFVYDYIFVTFIGSLPNILIYLSTYYLQIEGKTVDITVMIGMMIGVDVLLDCVFLFPLNMGMRGAALASVISVAIACVYGFLRLGGKDSNFRFRPLPGKGSEIKTMFFSGTPVAMINFADAIRLLVLNHIIFYFGGTSAMAIWAVLNCLGELALCIISGVPQAAAPMMGVFYTARENSGLRILVRIQTRIGILLSGIFAVATIVLHGAFEQLFRIDGSLVLPLVFTGIFIILELIINIWTVFFRSANRIMLSNVLIFLRRLVFPIICAIIFVRLDGLTFAFLPVGTLLAIFAGDLIVLRIAKKSKGDKHELSKRLLLDDYLERENKVIDFSINPTNEEICEASERIGEFCELNNMTPKQTMQIGLAIEEIMTVYAQKNESLKSVDLRAFSFGASFGIRIRCAGIRYNPFESSVDEEDFLMGIKMIEKISEMVLYTYSLGLNNISILFENE